MVNPAKFGFRHVVVSFDLFDYELVCLAGPLARLVEFVRLHFEDDTFDPQFNNPGGLHIVRRGRTPIIWLPRVSPAAG